MKIYIICSVRNCTPQQKRDADAYVASLEKLGHNVHYPPRDVDQNDPTGINICKAHSEYMAQCDEVHLMWNTESNGSHFDLGMAWAYKKPIKLIVAYQNDINNKSYLKVIKNWIYNK